MATFDTARLYGGRDVMDFGEGDDLIRVWFHHAQPEEVAIALDAAGLEQDGETIGAKGGGGDYVVASRLVAASVELAALCIEGMENYDHWPEKPRMRAPHGLMTLRTEVRERVPRVVLRDVGERIFEKSRLSPDEGKASERSLSLDS